MESKDSALKVIEIIENTIGDDLEEFTITSIDKKNLFAALIAIVLTQNTSDKNAIKVIKKLEEELEITPDAIINIGEEKLREKIRGVGQHNIRAKRIVEIAKIVRSKYNGSLEFIRDNDPVRARNALLELPGVGEKTADLLLLLAGHRCTFAVDTHIRRITHRLGFVPAGASYEEISSFWKRSLPPSFYYKAHLLLISFGRKICKSKKPLCRECPLKNMCRYLSNTY